MGDTDDRIVRIESKLDKVVDHLGSIDVTLAKNTVSLIDHIARTEILEEKIKPLDYVVGAVKILLVLATIGAGYEGAVMILKALGKL